MPTTAVRHQHRHYKTLILLVVCMTGGTLFLYWLGKLAPVTPLRAKTPAAWNQIVIRAVPARNDNTFYHLKINERGRLEESSAWTAQRPARDSEGVIYLAVTTAKADNRITAAQSDTLTKALAELRKAYSIPADKVRLAEPSRLAGVGERLRF